MAFEIGMSGSVTWAGTVTNVVRWACNIQRDVHDGTVMVPSSDGTYSWRRRILGHGSASGTVECLVDPAASDILSSLGETSTVGTPAVITLSTSEGATAFYTGSVLNSNVSITAEVDGINRVSFDFVSDGWLELDTD